MFRSAIRCATAGVAVVAYLNSAGCAAEGKSNASAPSASAGTGADTAGGADSVSAAGDGGASDNGSGGTGGNGGTGNLNPSPNGDGGAPDDSCAAHLSKAEVVPLDMYVLLDVSGSMSAATSTFDRHGVPISKWTAVKTALRSFLEDDSSAEVGVGIQYFPIAKANVPSSCASDMDCGAAAPCGFRFCSSGGQACVSNADCGTSVFNTCVLAGKCGTFDCVVGDPCNLYDAALTGSCAKPELSTCQHTVRCDAASYAAPARVIAPVATAGAGLLASIEAQIIVPEAPTPTGPALSGAIAQARTWAEQHPNHRVVAVLATDGVPTECSPLDAPDLGRLAAAGLAGKPSISTFTIGVFSGDAFAKGQYVLNTIAEGGGTERAFVINTSHDVANEFRAALDSIRSTQLACEFTIPEPDADERADYSLVNVNFKNGKKTSTLLYVGDPAECDPLTGGWYYDRDPEIEDPTRIVVCPTTCATFESASSASVEIAVGCKTIVK